METATILKDMYKDLVGEFKLVSDKGDMWGEAMGTFFTVAAELYHRGDFYVPPKWDYSPGMAEDPREPEDYFYDMCIECSTADLQKFGHLLNRYTGFLKRAGHSY